MRKEEKTEDMEAGALVGQKTELLVPAVGVKEVQHNSVSRSVSECVGDIARHSP